jgi:hypothetical protein
MVKAPPRAVFESVHDNQRHHRQQNNQDAENGNECHSASGLADFFTRHLAQRFAVAPDGEK